MNMRSRTEDQIERTGGRFVPRIEASTTCLEPPAWALAQRSLFRLLDEGWRRFARRRLALMEAHAGDSPGEEDIHLWQNLNPVVTEALTQLTWGAPQVLYNGAARQQRRPELRRAA